MDTAQRTDLFERIYRENFDRVARYLLARTDRETASDALARTFEIAWRRLEDVPSEPLPWLLGVARRVLADTWRSQRRRQALADRVAVVTQELVEDAADHHVRRQGLLEALGDLPASQREALLLVAWDGLSERQAASVLRCSRGAVALRLHRARRSLRTALERDRTQDTGTGTSMVLGSPAEEAT